jgi:hypothetical protein
MEEAKGTSAAQRNQRVARQAIWCMAAYMNSFYMPVVIGVSLMWIQTEDAGGSFYFVIFLGHLYLRIQGKSVLVVGLHLYIPPRYTTRVE